MLEKHKKIAKTNIEKLGFANTELYDKLHQNICLWLRNAENLQKILTNIVETNGEYFKTPLKKHLPTNSSPYFEQYIQEHSSILNPELNFEICSIQSEYPIELKQFIVGFIDLKVVLKFTYDFPQMIETFDVYSGNVILPKNKYWFDEYKRFDPKEYKIILSAFDEYFTIHFEVKSSFQTINAIEREIHFYQAYCDPSKTQFCIVAPAKPDLPNLKELLAQAKINYIECPAELVQELRQIEEEKYHGLEERVAILERQVQELMKTKKNDSSPGLKKFLGT